MNIKLRKSHYKIKNKFIYYKIITMILLLVMIAVAAFYRHRKVYVICFIMMNIIYLTFFLFKTKYVLNNLKNKELILTEYSEKILRIHKYIVFYYFVAVYICNIVYVCKIYTNSYDIKVWIWFALLLPVLYSDSVYLSEITAFGNYSFGSGEYIVNYSEIVEIREITDRNTIAGKMVLVSLLGKNGELGYDKLFVEEYKKLRLKVYQK